ncbi:MAG: type IV pilus secretin PilQ [Gammaproteobacteria bacterium]|nr:type IV pilus secretin PilQ [Gammaproteobacteria bacterium]
MNYKPSTNNSKIVTMLFSFGLLFLASLYSSISLAATNSIEAIRYSSLPGNRVQIIIDTSETIEKPLSFTIDNPARIAFDFPNTVSKLPRRTQSIGVGIATSVTAITAKDKTRVILNLTQLAPYEVDIGNKQVLISLNSEQSSAPASVSRFGGAISQSSYGSRERGVENIDFRRGEKGEGRVIVTLTDANIPMDVSELNGKVIIRFLGAKLPSELHQRLDVLDFATPVKAVDSLTLDDSARIEIEPVSRNYEHLAYQTDRTFTIELKPISKEELEEIKKDKFGYIGERLSLNFQDIPIRAVLQLIADFTNLNIVVSDRVDGNLTLRLKNVPWDQALDIILKAKGLDKRENGNVVLVAPSEEIAAQEKLELEAKQQVGELAPLRTAFFQVNYAKVDELKNLFGNEGGNTGLLSARGSVIVDQRTNSIMIKDTDDILTEVRRIMNRLDVPIRQVLIESRIVIATDDFVKELGVRFGVTSAQVSGNDGLSATSGSFAATQQLVDQTSTNLVNGNPIEPLNIPDSGLGTDRFNVNMPSTSAAGSIAFAILSGGNLLDLELSARQAENTSELIASPRVVTADRNEAFIESGVEIPYETTTSSGATQIAFKKAVLSIKVTPQITPDDRVILDLQVNKDAVGELFGDDQVPSIDTREVQTQVLVSNGDTVVLGGVYESATSDELDKVPFLGDLPLIGSLFRHSFKRDEKAELLIFVTPKILKEGLSL